MDDVDSAKAIEDALNFGVPKDFGMAYMPPPKFLYHYTNFAGFIGILKTNRIWATNARYLNDITDARQLWIFLEHRLRTIAASGKQFPLMNLDTLIAQVKAHTDDDSFVASFSEARDSLSQWRAYSGGGPGVCIGFAGKAVDTSWIYNPSGGQSHWTGKQFQKVQYIAENDTSLDTAIETLLKGVRSPMLTEAMRLTRSQFSSEQELVILLSLFHARFKHAAFQEEQEWRLSYKRYHKPMRHQQFRPGRTMLIPYIEAELNKSMEEQPIVEGDYIREVIAGPSAHAELNKQAIEQFLHSLGRNEIPVVLSNTPYRDW